MNLKKRFIGIVTFVSSDSEPSVVIVILCRYNDCRYIDCSYSDSDPFFCPEAIKSKQMPMCQKAKNSEKVIFEIP